MAETKNEFAKKRAEKKAEREARREARKLRYSKTEDGTVIAIWGEKGKERSKVVRFSQLKSQRTALQEQLAEVESLKDQFFPDDNWE